MSINGYSQDVNVESDILPYSDLNVASSGYITIHLYAECPLPANFFVDAQQTLSNAGCLLGITIVSTTPTYSYNYSNYPYHYYAYYDSSYSANAYAAIFVLADLLREYGIDGLIRIS